MTDTGRTDRQRRNPGRTPAQETRQEVEVNRKIR